MRKGDEVRLRHMLAAAKDAISFAHNKTRTDLGSDRMLALSIIKSIEILGEAAARVTEECQQQHSSIPWRNITAMRNRLIHVYFDVNLDLVWDTVVDDLPPLVAELERIAPTGQDSA